MARERISTYEIAFEGNLDPMRKAYNDATAIGSRAANSMQTSANAMARSSIPANQAFSAMGKIAEISGSSVARYTRNISELGSQILEMGSAVKAAGSLGAAVLPGIGLAITAIGAAVGYWISQNNKVKEQQEAIAAKAAEAAKAEQDKLAAMREQVAVAAGLQKFKTAEEASLKKQQAAFEAMKGQPERAAAAASKLKQENLKGVFGPIGGILATREAARFEHNTKIESLNKEQADRRAALDSIEGPLAERSHIINTLGKMVSNYDEQVMNIADETAKASDLRVGIFRGEEEIDTEKGLAAKSESAAMRGIVGVGVRAGVAGLKDLVGSVGGLFPKFTDLSKLGNRDRSRLSDEAPDTLTNRTYRGSLYDVADFRGMAPVQGAGGVSPEEKTNKNLETIKQILERIERRGGGMR